MTSSELESSSFSNTCLNSQNLRAKILLSHLPLHHSTLSHGLTLGFAVSSLSQADLEATNDSIVSEDEPEVLPGALTESHLRSFATPCRRIDKETQQRLAISLDETILSIADFFHHEPDLSRDERLEMAHALPSEILTAKEGLSSSHRRLSAVQQQISTLINQINDIHPTLHGHLTHVLSTHPPLLAAKRSASTSLVSATIETSLLKLSLIRARAHASLYSYSSQSSTMFSVLSNLSETLSQVKSKCVVEIQELDKRLAEYDEILQLVDGGGRGGGFRAVVDDWVSVQKEKEECLRDLRRLGWTGD